MSLSQQLTLTLGIEGVLINDMLVGIVQHMAEPVGYWHKTRLLPWTAGWLGRDLHCADVYLRGLDI